MTEEERRLVNELRVRMGYAPLEEEEGEGVLGTVKKATLPIRSTFGTTGHTGGRALGALFPGALEKAEEEMKQSYGLTEDSSLLEKAEALPGAGDVGAQLVPENIRESLVGRAVGPVARMAGNIVGDPLTWTPFVAAKAGAKLAAGVPAAAKAVGQLSALTKEAEAASKVARAGEQAMALAPKLLAKGIDDRKLRVAKAMSEAGGVRGAAWKAAEAIRRGQPMTDVTMAAVGYGPDVVTGIAEGAKRTIDAETIPEGIAEGVNTAFLTGMAALMGKGLVSTGRGIREIRNDTARNLALTAEEEAAIQRFLRGEEQAMEPLPPSRQLPEGVPPRGLLPQGRGPIIAGTGEAAPEFRMPRSHLSPYWDEGGQGGFWEEGILLDPNNRPPQAPITPDEAAAYAREAAGAPAEPVREPLDVRQRNLDLVAPARWYHQDHSLQPEHIGLAEDAIRQKGPGIHVVQVPVDTALPSALYGPAAGDLSMRRADVFSEVRGNREGPSRMIDRPMRPSNVMTVVGRNTPDGQTEIFTAYGGPEAPREPWDPSLSPEERAASRAFWNEHALATGQGTGQLFEGAGQRRIAPPPREGRRPVGTARQGEFWPTPATRFATKKERRAHVERQVDEAMSAFEAVAAEVEAGSGKLHKPAVVKKIRKGGNELPDLVDEFLEGRRIDPDMEYAYDPKKVRALRKRLRERIEQELGEEDVAAQEVALRATEEVVADPDAMRLRAYMEGEIGQELPPGLRTVDDIEGWMIDQGGTPAQIDSILQAAGVGRTAPEVPARAPLEGQGTLFEGVEPTRLPEPERPAEEPVAAREVTPVKDRRQAELYGKRGGPTAQTKKTLREAEAERKAAEAAGAAEAAISKAPEIAEPGPPVRPEGEAPISREPAPEPPTTKAPEVAPGTEPKLVAGKRGKLMPEVEGLSEEGRDLLQKQLNSDSNFERRGFNDENVGRFIEQVGSDAKLRGRLAKADEEGKLHALLRDELKRIDKELELEAESRWGGRKPAPGKRGEEPQGAVAPEAAGGGRSSGRRQRALRSFPGIEGGAGGNLKGGKKRIGGAVRRRAKDREEALQAWLDTYDDVPAAMKAVDDWLAGEPIAPNAGHLRGNNARLVREAVRRMVEDGEVVYGLAKKVIADLGAGGVHERVAGNTIAAGLKAFREQVVQLRARDLAERELGAGVVAAAERRVRGAEGGLPPSSFSVKGFEPVMRAGRHDRGRYRTTNGVEVGVVREGESRAFDAALAELPETAGAMDDFVRLLDNPSMRMLGISEDIKNRHLNKLLNEGLDPKQWRLYDAEAMGWEKGKPKKGLWLVRPREFRLEKMAGEGLIKPIRTRVGDDYWIIEPTGKTRVMEPGRHPVSHRMEMVEVRMIPPRGYGHNEWIPRETLNLRIAESNAIPVEATTVERLPEPERLGDHWGHSDVALREGSTATARGRHLQYAMRHDFTNVLRQMKPRLDSLGIRLQDASNKPWGYKGAGAYHMVYDVVGAGPKGEEYILRVGRTPYIPLPTEAQRQFVAPPAVEPGRFVSMGQEYVYTLHRKGYTANLVYGVDIMPLEMRRKLGFQRTEESRGPIDTDMVDMTRAAAARQEAYPPGISMGDFLEDLTDLYEGGQRAGLVFDDFVEDHPAAHFQVVKGGQAAYLPLDPNAPRSGIVRKGDDGRWYRLVITDYGAVYPRDLPGQWGKLDRTQRRSLMAVNREPGSALSLGDNLHEIRLYRETPKKHGVLNYESLVPDDYARRVGEELKGVDAVLGEIVDDFAEMVNGRLGEGAIPMRVRYVGNNVHPGIRGVFIPAATNEVSVNIVHSMEKAKTHGEAIDETLYSILHELTHYKHSGHDATFQSAMEYMANLADAEGKWKTYREKLAAAIPEDRWQRIRDGLVPEHTAMRREFYGYGDAEGLAGVPARDTAGRAEAAPDRAQGSAEGAAGGGTPGVRRGWDVLRRSGREAEGLGPAAAADAGGARRPPSREAVGGGRRGGSQQAYEARRTQVERYVEEEGGLNERAASKIIDAMMREQPKDRPRIKEVFGTAWQLAGMITKALPKADRAKLAEGLPAPRHPGQIESAINVTHLADVPDELKARVTVFTNITKEHWPRATPERWEDLEYGVQQMLGLQTPEEWNKWSRNLKRPLRTQDVMIIQEIHNEMLSRIGRAEERMAEAIQKDASILKDEGRLRALQDEIDESTRVYHHIAWNISEMGTKAGRQLAVRRRTIRASDPKLRWEQDIRAALRERMRAFIPDQAKADAKAQELYTQMLDAMREGGEQRWEDFYTALRGVREARTMRHVDKLLEWYKAGLIGIPSRAANIGSNTLFRGVRFLEDGLAGALDLVRSKITGKPREIYTKEAMVSVVAMKRAFAEGGRKWIQDTKDGLLLRPENLEELLRHGGMAEELMYFGGAVPGKLGRFIRFHLRGLGADDLLAKHVSRMDTFYREVYRKMRKGEAYFKKNPGEHDVMAVERIVDKMMDNYDKAKRGEQYDSLLADLWTPIAQKAEKVAREDTFQQDLGRIMQPFQQILRGHGWPLQIIFPFVRTPTNIFKETLKRTPLGYAQAMWNWKNLNPAEQMQALSRPLAGTLLTAGVFNMAMLGEVTGGGPLNPEEREALMSTGWQPYSLRIGNQWIAYNRLEPISAIIGFAADLAEMARRGEVDNWQDKVEYAAKSAAENMTNKTVLSGLDSTLAAVSQPRQYLPRFVRMMSGAVIPNSIGFVPFGHLARALDPVYRSTEAFTAEPMQAKIPFASQSLNPQYTPTGDLRMRPGTFGERLLLPFARKTQEKGPKADAADEIVRLAAAPRAPTREWRSPDGVKVPYTKEERAMLAQALQDSMTMIGNRLLNDPSYRSLPDTENSPEWEWGQKTKRDVLQSIINRHRRQVLARIKPGLVRRARARVAERRTERGQ